MSRAAFPFVLVTDGSNEVHNGLATFLYDDSEVSEMYFQITQETAAWNRNDYWGQLELNYEPYLLENAAELRLDFQKELESQVDIKDWSKLEERYDEKLLAAFNSGLEPTDISAAGLIIDGTVYLQSLQTRYGEAPFPRYTRHGVFSVTKSMGALVAMLRLAQTYGDEIFDLRLADYVDIKSDHDGWSNVTFGQALSMATGVGDYDCRPPAGYFTIGEDQQKFSDWLDAPSKEEKLEVIFSYENYDWGPGEVACYNSINTFMLSAAMDTFLKEQEGPDADIWQMVQEEVFEPIGIYHSPVMRTVEPDGSLGLPILGYGLYPTVDDTAKITALLLNDGVYGGEQLLSPSMLAKALYRTHEQGLVINEPNPYGESRYLYTFWSKARCGDDGCFQVPYMVGYGGNLVALLPNDVVAFRYADAHNYDVEPMIDLGLSIP